MLDKVNKNNYINYISDKTEIKNKKININQGKILVKSFWYATLSSLLLLIISYVFYFIWSKTFVSKIYVSNSSTYIVFGLCAFFIIASFVCSHMKIKKEALSESMKSSIFCYTFLIFSTSISFSLIGFIIRNYQIILEIFELGVLFFLLLTLITLKLNSQEKITAKKITYWGIGVLLILFLVVFLINVDPLVCHFDFVYSVCFPLLFVFSIIVLYYCTISSIKHVLSMNELQEIDTQNHAYKKVLTHLLCFMLIKSFVNIIQFLVFIALIILKEAAKRK